MSQCPSRMNNNAFELNGVLFYYGCFLFIDFWHIYLAMKNRSSFKSTLSTMSNARVVYNTCVSVMM